jgi:hypothetical protein
MNNDLAIKILSLIAITLGVIGLMYTLLIYQTLNASPTTLIPSLIPLLGGSGFLTYYAFLKKN